MKFIIFVEGYTEEKILPQFIKKWLDPKLPKPVGIKTVRFEGWPELLKDAPQKARMYLNGGDKKNIIAVLSLLELYGPTIYPNQITHMNKRYHWAKQYIEQKVNLPKFYQFFAVHEVEAWLLSQPEIFPVKIQSAFSKKIQKPENVNFNEPPSKMLERIYSQKTHRSYKKVLNGKQLFDKLDPKVAYQKCPKLKEFLDKLFDLANT
jgi:hypothetical protein